MSEQVLSPPKEQLDESHVQEAIQHGVELSDEGYAKWRDEFITDRLAKLEASSEPREFTGLSAPTTEFFHPNSEIKPLFLGRGFQLDDPQIYHAFLDTLHEFYGHDHWKDPAKFGQLMFYGLQYGIQKYFGNVKPSIEDQDNREKRLWASGIISVDDEVANPLARSISENKSEALCAERAAVAHNLLYFAGKESYFYTGELSVDGSKPEMHGFVIFKNSRGEFIIYDPMNPEYVENEEGKIVSIKPAAYVGGEQVLAGTPVEVEHERHKLDDQGNVHMVGSKPYLYKSNPFHKITV